MLVYCSVLSEVFNFSHKAGVIMENGGKKRTTITESSDEEELDFEAPQPEQTKTVAPKKETERKKVVEAKKP